MKSASADHVKQFTELLTAPGIQKKISAIIAAHVAGEMAESQGLEP